MPAAWRSSDLESLEPEERGTETLAECMCLVSVSGVRLLEDRKDLSDSTGEQVPSRLLSVGNVSQ